MEKQIVISISREYGSGGHEIAVKLAERLGIEVYDKNIFDALKTRTGVDMSEWDNVEENAGSRIFNRKYGSYSTNPADIITELQFDFIREQAEAGNSFVVVGRCSDILLKEKDFLFTVFVSGDVENKIPRVMERRGMNRQEAMAEMVRVDKKRRKFHNRHGDTKWGDSRHYDICINSRIGIDQTVDVLECMAKKFMEK